MKKPMKGNGILHGRVTFNEEHLSAASWGARSDLGDDRIGAAKPAMRLYPDLWISMEMNRVISSQSSAYVIAVEVCGAYYSRKLYLGRRYFRNMGNVMCAPYCRHS